MAHDSKAKKVSVKMDESEASLALLFLTATKDGHVSNPQMWEEWMKDAPANSLDVYVHAKNKNTGRRPPFKFIETVPTMWGRSSLVRAHLHLLRAALKNPKNKWFALLSEACLPMVNCRTLLQRLCSWFVDKDANPISVFETHEDQKSQRENLRKLAKEALKRDLAKPSLSVEALEVVKWVRETKADKTMSHQQWCILGRSDAKILASSPEVEAWLEAYDALLPLSLVKHGKTLAADELLPLTFLKRFSEQHNQGFEHRVSSVTFAHCCLAFEGACSCSIEHAQHPHTHRCLHPAFVAAADRKFALFGRKFAPGMWRWQPFFQELWGSAGKERGKEGASEAERKRRVAVATRAEKVRVAEEEEAGVLMLLHNEPRRSGRAMGQVKKDREVMRAWEERMRQEEREEREEGAREERMEEERSEAETEPAAIARAPSPSLSLSPSSSPSLPVEKGGPGVRLLGPLAVLVGQERMARSAVQDFVWRYCCDSQLFVGGGGGRWCVRTDAALRLLVGEKEQVKMKKLVKKLDKFMEEEAEGVRREEAERKEQEREEAEEERKRRRSDEEEEEGGKRARTEEWGSEQEEEDQVGPGLGAGWEDGAGEGGEEEEEISWEGMMEGLDDMWCLQDGEEGGGMDGLAL